LDERTKSYGFPNSSSEIRLLSLEARACKNQLSGAYPNEMSTPDSAFFAAPDAAVIAAASDARLHIPDR